MSVFEKLGNHMSTQERHVTLDAKCFDLFMQLLEVEGLTFTERNSTHIKILGYEQLLHAFANNPQVFKPS